MTRNPLGAENADQALRVAARELFSTYGYAGTHVRSITEAARVSVSTFYSRFGSKEQAYREIIGAEPPKDDEHGRALAGRALRTREVLLSTARECIERDGYHAVRISDIAERAGVSIGSFYTYFPSKLDIFTEVMRRCVAELRELRLDASGIPLDSETDERDQIRARLHAAITHYMTRFGQYAVLVQRMEEALGSQPELVPLWLSLHNEFAERITRSLRRWQRLGLADPALDAEHAGHALAAMVDHASRVWITYREPHNRDTAITTLTRLWAGGIGLDAPRPQCPA